MGVVILDEVTQLNTVKISELPEAFSISDDDDVPSVIDGTTQRITPPNFTKDRLIDGGNF